MKRFIALMLLLALCLSLVACGQKTEMSDGTIKEGLCYEATGISPDAVAMTVDGTEIPMDDVVDMDSSLFAGLFSD